MVVYLLMLSSECILLSLPAERESTIEESKVDEADSGMPRRRLYYRIAVIQSYGSSAYGIAALFMSARFGSSQECNKEAMIAIFRCFRADSPGLHFSRAVVIFVPVVKTIFFANDRWQFIDSAVKSTGISRHVETLTKGVCLLHQLTIHHDYFILLYRLLMPVVAPLALNQSL